MLYFMSKVNDKINNYKLQSFVLSAVCFFGAFAVIMGEEYSTGLRIIIGITIFFALLAIQAFYSIKKASIKCPECDKPIMTKSHTFDQNLVTESAYEKCYFCGHEFK